MDTLKYDVTVEDPGAYTRPWSASGRCGGWRAKTCLGIFVRRIDQ